MISTIWSTSDLEKIQLREVNFADYLDDQNNEDVLILVGVKEKIRRRSRIEAKKTLKS